MKSASQEGSAGLPAVSGVCAGAGLQGRRVSAWVGVTAEAGARGLASVLATTMSGGSDSGDSS